jgi:hypothetical protein
VLVLIFAVACFVRLYPVLVSGLPFSTDGWSCIRNSELLLQCTPVSLGGNSVFDGYHNYWPANSVFGAVVSEVLGLAPISVMAYGVPLAGALTVPLFFVLVRRVTERVDIALISSALLATVFPYALFTAGVTKETFANPLYIVLILVFLLRPSIGKFSLFFVASASLVLSHHLAAFVAVGILACLTVGLAYSKKGSLHTSVKWNVLLLAMFLLMLVGYFGLYASAGLTYTFDSSDLLSVGAYQILVLGLVLCFVSKPNFPSRKLVLVSFVATLVSALMLGLFITRKSLLAGAPVLPSHYLLYLSPFIVLVPLMMLGFGGLHKRHSSLLLPIFWLVPLVGLELYAVFGNSPLGLTLVSRMINFLLLPLCALFGIAFYKLLVYFRGMRAGRVLCAGVVATVLVVSCLNCYSVYAAVSLQEPYLGYFWLYRVPEAEASRWVSVHFLNGSVAGDVKVAYFLGDYFGVPVDVWSGLRFLGEDGVAPKLLFVYPEMSSNGYVVYGGYALELPSNWSGKLSELNHVYANNMVSLYGS